MMTFQGWLAFLCRIPFTNVLIFPYHPLFLCHMPYFQVGHYHAASEKVKGTKAP
jgi:hypothetical protein